jgi:hypothetical protein
MRRILRYGWPAKAAATAAAAALAFGAASPARADRRHDGSRMAARLATYFAGDGRFSNIACYYVAPDVRCRAMMMWPEGGSVVAVTIMLHRSGPGRGWYRLCVISFGVCEKIAFR